MDLCVRLVLTSWALVTNWMGTAFPLWIYETRSGSRPRKTNHFHFTFLLATKRAWEQQVLHFVTVWLSGGVYQKLCYSLAQTLYVCVWTRLRYLRAEIKEGASHRWGCVKNLICIKWSWVLNKGTGAWWYTLLNKRGESTLQQLGYCMKAKP